MKEFTYTIKDPHGFHARPIGKVVAVAKKYPCFATLWFNNKSFDLKKLLGLMGSGIKQGDTVTIRVEGQNIEECFDELQKVFAENL